MSQNQPAIEVSHLRKVFHIPQRDPGLGGAVKALFRPRYAEKVAVDDISFSVPPGEIVGYIGVNGAGKSTTIKMLTGILAPTAGLVRVLGRDPHKERVANARQIGVVFGQRTQLWWDLALVESLNLIARIYEVEPKRYKELLEQFSYTLELGELLAKPVRQMSLGQKMRAELAATLIHEPRVVYLDEPTIGLDVVVKEKIRAFIKEQNRAKGTTVVLTTHDLGDIEELCSRVIIIDAGRVIYDGPLATIRERFGKYRGITFETARPLEHPLTLPPGAEVVGQEERRLELRFDRTRASASQVAAAVMGQLEVLDFSLSEPDLTSIVKQIYGGALSEARPV
ncbi:ABC transporter ATP-binding protein [Calidithermus chliarophilus]|uniref:ABC transporter ATP-binding protein n=1 Tax=Calidithermus chliarophilus TaxID=52023 RepID=UPI00041C0945|nr:ATP-binding cassette domain-containing protein [Calidithermus chliarophilus]